MSVTDREATTARSPLETSLEAVDTEADAALAAVPTYLRAGKQAQRRRGATRITFSHPNDTRKDTTP